MQHPIDCLIITTSFALILEVKNISGRIDIDDSKHQCIRTRLDGTLEPFSNPTDQARKYQLFIQHLFQQWNVRLPVECAVVFANHKLILGNITSDVPLFHVSGLTYRIHQFFQKYPEKLSCNQVTNIADKLKSLHTPYQWQLKTARHKLRTGVLCERCNKVMHYLKGSWQCESCQFNSDAALVQAMQDYRLIWNHKITNREFRHFTGIESIYTANYLLKKLNFKSEGKFKDKVYLIEKRSD